MTQSMRNARLKNNKSIKNIRATVEKIFSRTLMLSIRLPHSPNLTCHWKSIVLSQNFFSENAEVSKSVLIRTYTLCCFHSSHIIVNHDTCAHAHAHTQTHTHTHRKGAFFEVMIVFYNMHLCIILTLGNYAEEIHSM